MNKTEADTYVFIGLRYLSDEDNKRVIDFFSSALEVDPCFAEVYQFMGIVCFSLGNYQAALDHFNNALALEPTSIPD
jgi:lipoprotein NlpI